MKLRKCLTIFKEYSFYKRILFLYKYRLLILKYLKVYFIIKVKQLKQLETSTKPQIYINLPDSNLNRYIYLFAHFLSNSFTVYFNPSFKLLTNMNDYSDWIINEPGVYLKKIKYNPNEGIIKLKNKTVLFKLNYDYLSAAYYQKEGFIFPYFMHVGQYRWNYIKQINELRKSKRSMSVFFVGGVSEKYYNNPKIKSIFSCLTRYEVLSELNNYSGVYHPSSMEDLKDVIYNGSEKLIIYITGEKWLYQKDWLSTIAKANFILALPGVIMPLCHHLIEAISVGTIPILQYNNFIYPALVHGENCLVFKDLDHLKVLLGEINTYSARKLDKMRRNVLSYYDNYFSENAFTKNFHDYIAKTSNNKDITIFINGENISSMLYERQMSHEDS